MRVPLTLVVMLALQILASVSLVEANVPNEDRVVGVNAGDWVKYVGAFPHEEHEWILASFSSIDKSYVNISISYDVRTPYKFRSRFVPFESSLSGDATTGGGNIFPFVIPSNLDLGEVVPTSSFFPSLTIDGIIWKEYAGQNRSVVFAASSKMPWNQSSAMYWDRLTGVLVEVVAYIDHAAYSSLKAVETNLWSYSLLGLFIQHFPFLALLSLSLVVTGILSFLFFRTGKPLMHVSGQKHDLHRILQATKQTDGSRARPLLNYLSGGVNLVYRELGKILIGSGFVFLIMGVFYLTAERQWFSFYFLTVAVSLFLIGVAVHFEVWGGETVGSRIGSFMVCVSVLAITIAFLTAAYREVGASVPYHYVIGFGGYSSSVATATVIEIVYVVPYVGFASALLTISFCLFVFGIFLKFRYGY